MNRKTHQVTNLPPEATKNYDSKSAQRIIHVLANEENSRSDLFIAAALAGLCAAGVTDEEDLIERARCIGTSMVSELMAGEMQAALSQHPESRPADPKSALMVLEEEIKKPAHRQCGSETVDNINSSSLPGGTKTKATGPSRNFKTCYATAFNLLRASGSPWTLILQEGARAIY